MKKGSRWRLPEALRDKWMTIAEAADTLALHRDSIYRKIECGVLDVDKYGARTIISRQSVQRYLKQWL